MKGFTLRPWLLVGGLAMLAAFSGCYAYDDVVDPCWPQRYNYMARQEVQAASAPQIRNGHVLDQTVWNWMFEAGTDKLTPGGMDHLIYLIRRRPCPDTCIYLATAQDLAYDPAAPEKFAEARCDLDAKRIGAIQKYLTAQTAGHHIDFQVTIHDPFEVGMSAIPANFAIQKMYSGAQGVLAGGGAAGGGPAGGR